MPGASCAFKYKFAVGLLNPKPMLASWLVLTPFTITGTAVFECERFCISEANAAPMSNLKSVYGAPGNLVVSNMLTPRESSGRPFSQAFRSGTAAAVDEEPAESGATAVVVSAGPVPFDVSCAAADQAK